MCYRSPLQPCVQRGLYILQRLPAELRELIYANIFDEVVSVTILKMAQFDACPFTFHDVSGRDLPELEQVCTHLIAAEWTEQKRHSEEKTEVEHWLFKNAFFTVSTRGDMAAVKEHQGCSRGNPRLMPIRNICLRPRTQVFKEVSQIISDSESEDAELTSPSQAVRIPNLVMCNLCTNVCPDGGKLLHSNSMTIRDYTIDKLIGLLSDEWPVKTRWRLILDWQMCECFTIAAVDGSCPLKRVARPMQKLKTTLAAIDTARKVPASDLEVLMIIGGQRNTPEPFDLTNLWGNALAKGSALKRRSSPQALRDFIAGNMSKASRKGECACALFFPFGMHWTLKLLTGPSVVSTHNQHLQLIDIGRHLAVAAHTQKEVRESGEDGTASAMNAV